MLTACGILELCFLHIGGTGELTCSVLASMNTDRSGN